MALISISEAAKRAGISRAHLYKQYINTGLISVNREDTSNPRIDTSELLRVFGSLQSLTGQPTSTAVDTSLLELEIAHLKQVDSLKDSQIHQLTAECQFLRERLLAYETRFLAQPVGFIPRLKLLMGGKP